MELVFTEIIQFLYKIIIIIIIISNHNALLGPKGPNPLLQYQTSNKQNWTGFIRNLCHVAGKTITDFSRCVNQSYLTVCSNVIEILSMQ
jgi:hypothetical protein